MATSGTFNFFPSVGEMVLNAYARCQIRRPSLTAEHFADARAEANYLQVEWSNVGVTLWTVDVVEVALTEGVSAYILPNTTITVLDAFIRTTSNGVNTDRYIVPVSRTEYASFPNKSTQSPPTVYWYDRLITPAVALYPAPDQNGPYTLFLYVYKQIEDANIPSGVAPQIPYRWLDAACSGLAARLAMIHKPELAQILDAKADRAFKIAANQDTETISNFYIVPQIGGYYR